MTRQRLTETELASALAQRPEWHVAGSAIARTFTFDEYADGVGFVVRVALLAERRDHHPEITLGWRKVAVGWSTHDAGGVTGLDLELAERTDALFVRGEPT